MISILKANQKLVDKIKSEIRTIDKKEVEYILGEKYSDDVIQFGFENSKKCWVVVCKKTKKPICIFGVSDISNGLEGLVWMLGTKLVNKYGIAVLRRSRRYVKEMLKSYIKICNYVYEENKIAIKWLKWCGFKFGPLAPYGVNGEMFHYFYMESDINV